VGLYFVKNVIIAFFNLELKSLVPLPIWTTTQPGLQKLKLAAKSIGTAENRLRVRQNTITYIMQL